jgi:hypothetical protein
MTEQRENDSPDGSAADRAGWSVPRPEILPKPTPWPVVVAFGSCLIAWGVVTSWIVSGVGLLAFIIGIRGWVVELADEQERRRSRGGTE